MSDEAGFSRRYAWYVVILLTAAYAVALLDRIVISLLIEPIKQQFGLSDSGVALLSGAAFGLCYSIMALPFGWLADRANRRWIVTFGIASWSIATALCGVARSFTGLFAARVAVGIGEASLNPSASSIIADLFSGPARAKAYGVFVAGTSFGTGAAFLLGGAAIDAADAVRAHGGALLADFATWQIVFLLTSLPGLLVAALFVATVREPKRRERDTTTASPPLLPFLRANKGAVASVIIGLCCNLTSVYALIAWYPVVLIRVHGWSQSDAGYALGVIGPPAALVGAIGSGWLIARVNAAGRKDAALLVAIVASVIYGAMLVLSGLVADANLSLVFYFLGSLCSNSFSAAAFSALAQLAPNELRGRLTGLYTLMIGLVSLNLGPVSVGLFSDYVFGEQRLNLSFAATVALDSLLASVILLAGRGPYRRSVGAT
ncbi:MFS transporter [Roseiterribacter gracilis]|uniref:MFS transporter n=1 Tax=Roseiterribacter gracilis TaxID=2812848 RepID=A0A8S8XCK6_9PROT|nr:MFS transporter [Rhodospirillales bacterium TMPK1]